MRSKLERACHEDYLGEVSSERAGEENNYFTEMCSGSEEGSYLRLIDFCITQL